LFRTVHGKEFFGFFLEVGLTLDDELMALCPVAEAGHVRGISHSEIKLF
jgi:hypothetical protein